MKFRITIVALRSAEMARFALISLLYIVKHTDYVVSV